MSQTLESPRWQAVGLVIDLNTKDHLAGRYGLVQDLVAWFKAVRLFRETEDERMVLQDPTPADLRQHRTWLASLIAEGERLVSEARSEGGLPEGLVRFKLADVEATLEMLLLSQREWHGPQMSPERRREILKRVFKVEEPAA
ncbi:MAG: hypothetical protein HYY24_25460 [Verrucomicrobia bacterium]|nr:hypothetical protein [Verrucomicrobiota bacterium]